MLQQDAECTPDQQMLIIDRRGERADQVVQVEAPWRYALNAAPIRSQRLRRRFSQVDVFPDIEQEEVQRRPRARADPRTKWCVERNLDVFGGDIAALVDQHAQRLVEFG